MLTINNGRIAGRLGNQLFQYATLRSLANKLNYNYYVSLNNEQITRFNLPIGIKDGDIKYEYLCPFFTSNINKNNIANNDYWNIKNFTNLGGYFQHSEYFDFNYNNIKNWFNTDNLIDMKLFNKLKNKYRNYCFIHIRGNDYIGLYDLPLSYYKQAIRIMKQFIKCSKFIIITDDIQLSKKILPNIKYISNIDYLIDFKLLQTSEYLISSNSTFSWWAAYLNENAKKIIYPFGGLFYGKDTIHFSKCNKFEYI